MADKELKRDSVLPAGTLIGPYSLVRMIGEGGMARIYLATEADGSLHVLKIPRSPTELDPASQIAFENELRLAPYLGDFAQVVESHQNDANSERFLVLSYIDGTDLWSHLSNTGCLDERNAVALTRKIVRAVAELHDKRIVHLDLKLSNIMLTRSGEVCLIDFGLANHLDLPDLILESFKEPKGTPAYIAPEQFLGVRDEPRSDIFSIGTLLFEMTTSRLPFIEAHNERDVISRIKRKPTSPRTYRPDLSKAFEAIIMTCLETVPDRRFRNMKDLDMALERLEQSLVLGLTPTAHTELADLNENQSIQNDLADESKDRLKSLKNWIARHRECRPAPPYRIVVALENRDNPRTAAFNRKLLASAYQLARTQSSIITVLTVLGQQDTGMACGEREMQIINANFHQARSYMNRLLSSVDSNETPVGINVRTGNVVDAIQNCVNDYGADLLVIGARDRNPISRFLLGSTAYKVLTTLSCPVFVVRENRKESLSAKPQVETDREPLARIA